MVYTELNKYMHRFGKFTPFLFYIVTILFAAIINWPILGYEFFSDDYLYFYQIANNGFWNFIITPYGGHMMPFRNCILFLLYKSFALNVSWYFAIIFLTHLLNVILLNKVIRAFTNNANLAMFFSVVFGISPINQGTLGWFCAFGIILVTTFFLIILYDIGKINNAQLKLSPVVLLKWYVILIAASLSYGTGIPIAMGFSLIIWLFLPAVKERTRIALVFLPLSIIVPLIYFSLNHLYNITNSSTLIIPMPSITNLHIIFDFIMLVIGFISLSLSAFLVGPYMNYLHNHLVLSLVFISILSMFSLLLAYYTASREVRYQLVAIGLVIVLVYGIIAVGRIASIGLFGESVTDLIATPRFHYLSILMCMILYGISLNTIFPVVSLKTRSAVVLICIILFLFMIPSVQSTNYVYNAAYSNNGSCSKKEFDSLKKSVRSELNGSDLNKLVVFQNQQTKSIHMLLRGYGDFPGYAALFVIAFPDNDITIQRIRFVEDDRNIVDGLRNRYNTRISGILINREMAAGCSIKKIVIGSCK